MARGLRARAARARCDRLDRGLDRQGRGSVATRGRDRPRRVPCGLRAAVHGRPHGARLPGSVQAPARPFAAPPRGANRMKAVADTPDAYYIVNETGLDPETRALKDGETFGV